MAFIVLLPAEKGNPNGVISRRSDACPRDVGREVLRYLMQHPAANDTIEGIAHWWLLEQRIENSLAEVQEAMVGLVASKLVVAQEHSDGRTHYRIDAKRKPEILRRLEKSPARCVLK